MSEQAKIIKALKTLMVPLKDNIITSGTLRESKDMNHGIHDLLIEVPILWLESIVEKIENGQVSEITDQEISIVKRILYFLRESDILGENDDIQSYVDYLSSNA